MTMETTEAAKNASEGRALAATQTEGDDHDPLWESQQELEWGQSVNNIWL